MRNTVLASLVLSGSLILSGCSGDSSSSASLRLTCIGGEAFCVISCDLGCTRTGCAVTEIAENQRLRFKFSDRIDPASVNGASFSIRTPTGAAPDGELVVVDNQITFKPSVRTVNGISTFGFQRNESYIISLAGASSGLSIRSSSGQPLDRGFSCTVVASRGILDEDQLPPTVELLSPTNLTAAPVTPTIVLRFSELIDTTALQGPIGEASPIQVSVFNQGLQPGVCGPTRVVVLEGVPLITTELVGDREVTVVTFQPSVQINARCVKVVVTSDLRDLSGRSAVPATFQFWTEQGVSLPITITENFANAAGQDPLTSGGIWSNGARPGLLGGDGRHGSFNATLGTPLGGGTFEWDASNFTIPASSSLNGTAYQVTDGRFYFTDFVLESSQTVRFTGTVPPVITVRGQIDVRGTIQINGSDLPFYVPSAGAAAGQRVSNFDARGANGATILPFIAGQPGSLGGCGGGRGGRGGDEAQNNGPSPNYDGQPGEDVRLLAGHAYAGSAVGTGGRGSTLMPANGLSTGTPLIGSIFRANFSPGGAGGGFWQSGGARSVIPVAGAVVGPLPAVGAAFPVLPYPPAPPPGYSSVAHFLVGGSGGGGGGSHQFGTNNFLGDLFIAGSAGTGGGGALALRGGGAVAIAASAVLQARGGDGVLINGNNPGSPTANTQWGVSSPGGGGSGGSVLIQSGRDISVAGSIDTRGGTGSRTGAIEPATLNILAQGGNGSPGYFRLEAAGNVAFGGSSTPPFSQPANTGALTDRDSRSGDWSTWRGTGQLFSPNWLRYELDVDLDGDGVVDITYTDSGAPGTVMANDPNGPLVILFQGAELNQAGTAPKPGTVPGPWREGIGLGAGPGIALDSPTGVRFQLDFNRAQFPNVVVRALRIFAQT